VKPYKKVKEDREKATKWVVNDLTGLAGVKARLIGGLIGRLGILGDKKKVEYIVGAED
jgi:hypothetical protein